MNSRRSLALLGVLTILPATVYAQASQAAVPSAPAPLPLKHAPQKTTAAISTADLMTRLYIFADDSMMGREAGTVGALKGTAYIASELKRLGLEPAGDSGGYFQTVPFIARTLDPSTSISVNGTALVANTDYVSISFRGGEPRSIDGAEVVYGGAVGGAQSLTADQAKGRFVVMQATPGVVQRIGANSPLFGAAGLAYVSGPSLSSATLALGHSPTLTLPPAPKAPPALITLNITSAAAEKMLGAPLAGLAVGATGGKVQGNLKFVTRSAPTRNVVAILRGTDRALRNEFVAVGAHSDHIGYRAAGAVDHDSLHLTLQQRYFATENPTGATLSAEDQKALQARVAAIHISMDSVHAVHAARRDSINNGADDDGSGSVTVLELAEAFARGKVKPKRSILFVWHTGEEKGLLGSRYFVEHPTVPRDSIVAQINIDMVGRGAASDLREGGDRYLQLVGSRRLSTELGDLVEQVNASESMPFSLDYTFDANGHPDNIYCRSDHYNYARYGIPVVFLTTGLHGDYHQVTDEPQYIDYPHMARVGGFVFDVVNRVAGLDHRPVVDKPKPDPAGACRQ